MWLVRMRTGLLQSQVTLETQKVEIVVYFSFQLQYKFTVLCRIAEFTKLFVHD